MMTSELLAKGKAAKSAEELKEIAASESWQMTDEEARAYFDELQKCVPAQTGELSDDELDNVSGGGCHKGGRLVVTICHSCEYWACRCGYTKSVTLSEIIHSYHCPKCMDSVCCRMCKYCSYEKGLWLCNNPRNMK